jgi:hypothetical protein
MRTYATVHDQRVLMLGTGFNLDSYRLGSGCLDAPVYEINDRIVSMIQMARPAYAGAIVRRHGVLRWSLAVPGAGDIVRDGHGRAA